MTKEEAVKRFQRMKKTLSIPNSDAARTIEAIDMAIEALQDDWTPVSSGNLPKVGEYVLASVHDYYAIYNIIINKYEEQVFWNNGIITAWKPLPEPYNHKAYIINDK